MSIGRIGSLSNEILVHESDTSDVHGIANTSLLVTLDGVQSLNNKTLGSPAMSGTPTAPTAAVDTNTTQLATTAFVLGQAASTTPVMDGTAAVGTSTRYARADHVHASDTSRAPLASPALTGTPTAPTAAGGTNTTQIATTAFVRGEVTSLVNSAPAALDTLSELATALGNDANFSTTVTNSIATKANTASPTFTGTAIFDGLTVTGTARFQEVVEDVVDVAHTSNALTCDYALGNVYFMATAFTGNGTVNVTNAPTTDGRVFSVTLFVTQGATGYNPTTLNINGSAATIRWNSGSAPTPTSGAGKIDVYTFTLVRRASAWTVLATMVNNF